MSSKYTDVTTENQKRYDKLLNECHVFWAFSNEQFKEGKAKNPIQPGEKYVSIGMGGYMPKKYHRELTVGLKTIGAWKRAALKNVDATETILYELNNHECFYTGDYTDALDVLTDLGYTEEQVKNVFENEAGAVA